MSSQQGSAEQGPAPSNTVKKCDRIPSSAYDAFGTEENGIYTVKQQPLGTQRPLKVIMLGGGASGINMAFQMRKFLPQVQFYAYEKNPELSGTWYENRYPGCACDIPSHTYQFAWHPNPNWSAYYVGQKEIKEYFLSAVRENDLEKYFHVNHRVIRAIWEEETSKWYLTLRSNDDPSTDFEDWCDFFINGSGILNAYKWPDVKGLNAFEGIKVHSANWLENLDLSGKRIGLIGVGSTATQLVPALQPIAKSLSAFCRSKTWITPPIGAKYAGPNGSNVYFSEEQKKMFVDEKEEYNQFRKNIEYELNSRFKFLYKDSPEQKTVFDFFTNWMSEQLKDRPDLQNALIPDFAVGCRRLTPGGGFLPALQADNVSLITDPIDYITKNAIVTKDGTVHEIDALVCATGFDLSFKPRFELRGRNNADLRDQWTPRPSAYVSAFAHNFPNYSFIMGPGAPLAQGSMIPSTERIAEYIIQVIFRLATEPILSIEVSEKAEAELWKHYQEQIKQMVWTSSCSSAFKNGDINAPIDVLHPGSRMHYFAVLERPRWEDFKYKYSNNRFAHLGNGTTLRENQPGRDLTYYLLDDVLKLQDY